MTTASRSSPVIDPAATTLLADYEGWLHFVTTSRRITREWDHKLARIAARHTEYREFTD